MKIGIDARMLGGTFGLGRYVEKLVTHLEEIDQANDYVIFLRKENWDRYAPRSARFKKVLADIPWYSIREQCALAPILQRERCDVMHFPHWNVPLLYGGPFVMTIHDLTMLRLPLSSRSAVSTRHPLVHAAKHAALRAILAISIRRARRIIAVSAFVQDDITRTFHLPSERVVVIHEAADAFSGKPKAPNTPLPAVFILYVGSCYPHKNLSQLLDVWATLKKNGDTTALVLCGQEDLFTARFRAEVERRGLLSLVRHIGTVSDAELSFLYRHALALITASKSEGFGLQIVEAMQSGTAVLCSDLPVFREIASDAALYFNRNDADGILEALSRIERDRQFVQELSQKGRLRASQFSWDRTAEQTKKIYEQVTA